MDGLDVFAGRWDPLVPPRNRNFVGDGDFRAIGEEFRRLLTEVGGLKPGDRVLDVGSGIGRMAVPLTRYLSPEGSYCGLEIVADGVEWCRRRITPRHSNFQFVWADVYNKMYNPEGRSRPSEYRFPFGDDEFDFVFLTSVFTHMFPADVENYLGEIARVLRPGGRCFATFFLLTPESRELIRSGKSTQAFQYEGDGYLTISEDTPERATAFDERWVREIHSAKGLQISEPIRYGSWCGREHFTSYQDIVLSDKHANVPV